MSAPDLPNPETTRPAEDTGGGPYGAAPGRTGSVRRWLAIALAVEVALFAIAIEESIASAEGGSRTFWFLLSVFWLYRIQRGGRMSWALMVAFGVFAAAIVTVGAGGGTALVFLLLLGAQVGALVARPVREHVGAVRGSSASRKRTAMAR